MTKPRAIASHRGLLRGVCQGHHPVEPKVLEFKFYARGVGPVLEITASGGSDRDELVSFHRGR